MKDETKNDYLINEHNRDKISEIKEFINEKHSEIIIGFIINKIIIKAMNEVKSKEIDEKMNVLCCDYVINNLNNILKSQFFNHENELNNEKYFNKDKELISLAEPVTPEFDRNNSNMMKINNYKDLSIINEIFESVETKKSSLIETEKCYELKKKNINKKVINEENSSNSLNSDIIISLPCTDLEKNKYTNIFIEQNMQKEYNILRKERELEIKRKKQIKDLEKKIVIKKELKEEKNIKKLSLKKIKKKNGLNISDLSFDSDGNIIKKKLIPIDSLVKDFNFVKIILNKNKKIKSGFKTSKNAQNNFLKKEKYKLIPNELDKAKINFKEPLTERNNILEKIEYNPRDKENIYHYNKYKLFPQEDRSIFFSSSFNEKLIPETGVELKTDILHKKGGKNFFNKYNRISMEEYKNFILNNSNKSNENINMNINNVLNLNEKNFNYNGYTQKFEENNPLIKGANKADKILNLKLKKIAQNKNRFLSNNKIKTPKWKINNFSNSLILSNDNQSLSNNNFDKLYNYLSERNTFNNHNYDSSKESSAIKANYYNKMKSSNDILKNIIKKRIKIKKAIFPIINDTNEEKNVNNSELINSMEQFNRKIINDVNFNIWGNNNYENITNKNISTDRNQDLNQFSFYRKLNKHKLDNKRERKNIVDIIKNNKKLKGEKN